MTLAIKVKQADPTDASNLLKLFSALYQESDYLVFEPGEFKITEAEESKLIEKNMGSKSWVLFIAVKKGELVGFLGGNGGNTNRSKHSIQIAMGVLSRYQGKGIGRQLLQAFINWASENQFHRIELSVIESNKKAISLYTDMGFEIEGRKHDSLKVNGSYVNEYCMGKLIQA